MKTIIDYLKVSYIDLASKLESGELPETICLIYLNPFNYFWLKENFQNLSNTSYRIDGIYASTLIEKLVIKTKKIRRQSFDMTSLAPMIFKYCENNNLTIFVAGGNEGEAEIFVGKISKLYPSIKFAGVTSGYQDEEEIISKVLASNSDVTILGLGNKKQESVASKLSQIRPSRYFTCGAFISQTAASTTAHYYPKYIDALNIRWLYRLAKERHILRRVLIYYPRFAIAIWKDAYKEKRYFN